MAPPGTFRVLGRLTDLRRIDPRQLLDRLDMNPLRWRLAVNRSWLDESIRRGQPFFVVWRCAIAGSVFEWELQYLRVAGYRRAGCWLIPRDYMTVDLSWLPAPRDQVAILQSLADQAGRAIASCRPPSRLQRRGRPCELGAEIAAAAGRIASCNTPGEFETKTRKELDPFLALAPHVVGVPFPGAAPGPLLIGLRAVPMHILGVTTEPAWADGRWCSPAEYFFHDLDHARFKIREDLLALGYDCPDAYPEDHGILRHVQSLIGEAGPRLWQLAPARLAMARRLLDAIASLQSRDRSLGDAAELFLLEIVHEKSFPMDSAVLHRELHNDAHHEKLQRKCAAGFYGADSPRPELIARFDEARAWLIPTVAAAA
jgi:hypothetical protein